MGPPPPSPVLSSLAASPPRSCLKRADHTHLSPDAGHWAGGSTEGQGRMGLEVQVRAESWASWTCRPHRLLGTPGPG